MIVFILTVVSQAIPSVAQELPLGPEIPQETTPEATPISAEEIAKRRKELATELAEAEAALARAENEAAHAHCTQVLDRLRGIDGLLRQQAELTTISDSKETLLSGPETATPSAFALNVLYEAQLELKQNQRRRAAAITAKRDELRTAKERLQDAERKRRQARQDGEDASGATAPLEAKHLLRVRELASREAQENVNLWTLELRLAQRTDPYDEENQLEARIETMRAALANGEGRGSAGFAVLTDREGRLQRTRETRVRELPRAELRLEAAQKRFAQQSNPSAELLEEADSQRITVDALHREIGLIDSHLKRLDTQRSIWQQWESVLANLATREDIEAWEDSVADRIANIEQAESLMQGRADDLQQRIETLQGQLSDLPDEVRTRPALEQRRTILSQLYQAHLTEIAALGDDRRVSERLLADIRERTNYIDPLQYTRQGMQIVRDAWNYEITVVEDEAVTVGSLLLALLLASAGHWTSRRTSAFVRRVATNRFGLEPGAAHALETLSFYVLLISFTLLALRAVHFPLTMFTVLGGALAIGIGFGSQNVMNNFISGLILMLERPVRAGDVVEVDGNHGAIEKIGGRSTQIRSTDGRHIIVPNSFFLENNVVNWTLSDDLIRVKVSVGVVYGSPTRLVEQLIARVVREEKQVLQKPAPIIIFEEFGDNSLNFDVYFWVRARSPMETRKVQSCIRFRIDDLFREHELVIAFPQRDVHLDSAAPLQVQMLDGHGQVLPVRQAERAREE